MMRNPYVISTLHTNISQIMSGSDLIYVTDHHFRDVHHLDNPVITGSLKLMSDTRDRITNSELIVIGRCE